MQHAVLFILGLGITLYFIYSLVTTFRKTKPPQDWPVTEGKILLLKGDQVLVPSILNRISEIMFTFSYEVNGTQYTGTWYGPIPGLKEKLLKGEPLQVYYDPGDPQRAFLQGRILPVVTGLYLLMIATGLGIMVAAVLLHKEVR